jgi:hypothetical protein
MQAGVHSLVKTQVVKSKYKTPMWDFIWLHSSIPPMSKSTRRIYLYIYTTLPFSHIVNASTLKIYANEVNTQDKTRDTHNTRLTYDPEKLKHTRHTHKTHIAVRHLSSKIKAYSE